MAGRDENVTDTLVQDVDKQDDKNKRKEKEIPQSAKLVFTGILYASFMGFSLALNLYGPSLSELQIVTSSSLDQISWIFTWLGVGGIVGYLIFGYLFDRCQPLLLLGISLSIMAVATTALPWCRQLEIMFVVAALQSFAYCGVSTGTNVTIFRLWGDKASPVLLGMQFLYTLGGAIPPLLCSPFKTAAKEATTDILIISTENLTVEIFEKNVRNMSLRSEYSASQANVSELNVLATNGVPTTIFPDQTERSSNIFIAYAIVGAYFGVIAISSFMMLLYVTRISFTLTLSQDSARTESVFQQKILIPGLIFILFNHFVGGLEVIFPGFISVFVAKEPNIGTTGSSLLIGYFVAYGFGRFITIFSIKCISPRQIVALHTTCFVVSLITLSVLVLSNAIALWACTILMAFGVAVLFTTNLLWAQEFVAMTGRFIAVYAMSFNVGVMVWPAVTGQLMENEGPQWFPFICLALSAGCVTCIVVLFLLQQCCSWSTSPGDVEMEKEFISK